MHREHRVRKYGLLVLGILFLTAVIQAGSLVAEDKQTETKVVFYVYCFDVGHTALKDLKGVHKVLKGIKNSREINTVYFDPEVITVKQMEEALKKAKTYRGTEKKDDKS